MHAPGGSVRNTSLHAFGSFLAAAHVCLEESLALLKWQQDAGPTGILVSMPAFKKVASALHMASAWPQPVTWLLDLQETAAVFCGFLQKMASTYSHVLSSYPHINGKESTGLPSRYSVGSGGRKKQVIIWLFRCYVHVIGVGYSIKLCYHNFFYAACMMMANVFSFPFFTACFSIFPQFYQRPPTSQVYGSNCCTFSITGQHNPFKGECISLIHTVYLPSSVYRNT